MDPKPEKHSKFVLYETDGRGRDTYISYNNGGFWKDNVNYIFFNPKYGSQSSKPLQEIRKNASPCTYYSDGSGRDSYIIANDGGMKRSHQPLKNYHLKDFLRTPESCIFNFKANPLKEGIRIKTHYLSKKEFEYNCSIRNLEKGLMNRLYTSHQNKRNNTSMNNRVCRTEGNFYPNIPQKEFRFGRKKVRVTLDNYL